jgi:hypothetical protein
MNQAALTFSKDRGITMAGMAASTLSCVTISGKFSRNSLVLYQFSKKATILTALQLSLRRCKRPKEALWMTQAGRSAYR